MGPRLSQVSATFTEKMLKNRMITMLAATIVTLVASIAVYGEKLVGGDLSLLLKYEQNGAKYYDKDGVAISDVLSFVKQQGWNTVRVRLFVDPTQASDEEKGEGVCQDLAFVTKLGKRIKDLGLKFMLDFHYSDSWADPLKQYTPASWASVSEADLPGKVYTYTSETLQTLIDADAKPDLIQTGNEIAYGMLWGVKGGTLYKCNASSGATEWARFAKLLNSAAKACREKCPEAKIVIHHDRSTEQGTLYNFYTKVKNNSVDYDIIGLSYYPQYQGSMELLDQCLTMLGNSFADKEVMIVETGYHHKWPPEDPKYDYTKQYPATDAGQCAFTEALIAKLNKHENVTGLYWWWAEANEYGVNWATKRVTDAWYNAGLWDNETGRAMTAAYVLKNFLPATAIDDITTATHTDPVNVYTIDGRLVKTDVNPSDATSALPAGIYVVGKKKIVVR